MKRLAVITIGQSPREDITGEFRALLSSNMTLIERGALDTYTLEQVQRDLTPQPGQEVLVTRMRDGTSVIINGAIVPSLVQECVDWAENEGVDGIVLLCTGTFRDLRHRVPLISAQPLLHAVVKAVAAEQKVGVLTPDASQVGQARAWWRASGVEAVVVPASPYGSREDVVSAAQMLKQEDIALICLDCMGYTVEMKQQVAEATGKPVILPRSLVARVADEMFGRSH